MRAGGHLPTLWTGRLVTAGRGAGRVRASTLLRCQETEEAPEERPVLYGDFVRRPLVSPYKRTAACRRCSGCGTMPCTDCAGSGRLRRGGYQKRNPVSAVRVIGSKWTAMERTFGWRHFRVLQKKGQGKDTFVLMAATCDESTQLWVNMQNLKDRARWASGWLQRQEMQAAQEQQHRDESTAAGRASASPAGTAGQGTACRACSATGAVPCPICSLAGQLIEL